MSKNTNKGGRPAMDASEKRTVRLSQYLTKSEYAELQRRVQLFGYRPSRKEIALFVSEKVHQFVSDKQFAHQLKMGQFNNLTCELSRLANNFNQLTAAINSGKCSIEPEDMNVVLELKRTIDLLRREILLK